MSRLRRLGRAFLLAVVLIAALGALAVYLARDAPRAAVESALAERVGARVELGALSIEGFDRFVLHDLAIGALPAYPFVHAVHVDRLEAIGDPRAMTEGIFDAVLVDGVRVVLGEPASAPTVDDTPPPRAGRLVVERIAVALAGGEGGAPLATGRTEFDDAGAPSMRGFAAFEAPQLDVVRLAALSGLVLPAALEGAQARIEGVAARGDLDGTGGVAVRVTAGGGAATLPRGEGAASLALPAARLDVDLDASGEAALAIVWDTGTAWGPGTATARLRATPLEVRALEADAPALDLGALAAAQPELVRGGVGLEGTAALRARLEEDGRLAITARADSVRASAEALAARALFEDVALDASLALAAPGEDARATLRATIAEREGVLPVAANVTPARLEADVTLAPDFAGDARFRTRIVLPEWGSFAADGVVRAFLGDDARWDARCAWTGPDPEHALALARTLGIAVPAFIVTGPPLAARGEIEGALLEPRLVLRMALEGLSVRGAEASLPWSLQDAALALDAEAAVGERGASIPALTFALNGRAIGPSSFSIPVRAQARLASAAPPQVSGTAELDLADGAAVARLSDIAFDGTRASASLALTIADLERVRALAQPLTGALLPGYAVKGSAHGDLALQASVEGVLAISGPIAVKGLGVASADGARVAEGFEATWAVTGERDATGALKARATAAIPGPLVLWDSFFADFSALEADASLAFDAGSEASGGVPWSAHAAVALDPGVALRAALGPLAARDGLDARVDVHVSDFARLLGERLREPFVDALPMLAGAKASGSLDASMQARLAGERMEIDGDLTLRGTAISLAEPALAIEGLDLALPVALHLENGAPARVQPAARMGRLSLARATAAGFEIGALASEIASSGDGAELAQALEVPLFGGRAVFTGLSLSHLLDESRALEAGLDLDGVSLAEISALLDFFPLEGTLRASFPRIKLSPSRFAAEGGGVVDVFSGRVAIGDVTGEDVLSRYPRFQLDATLRDIDLRALTGTIGFGEMTGFVEGEIRDLLLVGGVPVRFDAEVRSVAERRENRTVNVTAVNNLTILGTGGPGALDRGIARLFDRFTYESLGLRMTLADDRFLLRGLERRGDRELFLKGRLPLPIDIVNGDPGRAVSFKAMLRRFQELDLSRVRTD